MGDEKISDYCNDSLKSLIDLDYMLNYGCFIRNITYVSY